MHASGAGQGIINGDPAALGAPDEVGLPATKASENCVEIVDVAKFLVGCGCQPEAPAVIGDAPKTRRQGFDHAMPLAAVGNAGMQQDHAWPATGNVGHNRSVTNTG